MVRLCCGALVHPCSLWLKRSRRVTKSVYLARRWRRTRVSTSTLPASVRRAFAGFANSGGSGAEAAVTLVHAFVTSRVDYCNAILAGASKSTTDKLQRVYWMLSLASSATRGSTTADSAISCTTSCTGWTFLSRCSTSCLQLSIDVCSTKHHSTWRTAASTPQALLVGSICGPPAAISPSYRDIGVRCSVVGPFLWLARWPSTPYQTTCEIRHVPLTVFAGTWKLFFSRFYRTMLCIRGTSHCPVSVRPSVSWPVFWNFTPHVKSPQRLTLETSNFVHGSVMRSLSLVMSECSLSGRGQGHLSNFWT